MNPSMPEVLTLGHSPDPDDAFMFYGLAKNRIDAEGLVFEHILQDIQTLNERALRGELDISAISFHAYPGVASQYALLPCGASMGDGYGPRVVAREIFSRETLRKKTFAIPGRMTSAFLALQLWLERSAEELDYKVVPFDQVLDAVKSGLADCGLVIHEGQLTFEAEGLKLCQDLGAWWKERTGGLPLPLGGNVVHKRLAPSLQAAIARVIRRSIEFGLSHRAEAVAYALPFGRGLDHRLADQFVGMYVNEWTLDLGERGRESLRLFYEEAAARGYIQRKAED